MKTFRPGVTCVTLSSTPFKHTELPCEIAYVNSVQTFKDIYDYYKYWRLAVEQVETEVFFVQDYDDPLPNHYPKMVKGIHHGDYIEIVRGKRLHHNAERYSKRQHIGVPSFIHKAFCNTSAVLEVLKHLPLEGKFLPEGLVYYPLIHCFGRVYDRSLEMAWIDHPGGLHYQKGSEALVGTRNFLTRYGEDICNRVTQAQKED